MERRLQKDFQIGMVEGIVQAVIQSEKEPKDVFSQIAKAIGRKGSGSTKKDWNAVVRQSTVAMDPIGSSNEAMQRQTRRSLRRHLQHQPDSDLASMDPKRLLDYNPNLLEFTPVTRIAYAKFMMSKSKPNEQPDDTNGSSNANESVDAPQRSSKILKSMSEGSINKLAERTLDVKITETRSPSPIPEDPVEEEASKQSTSAGMSDQEKKIEEKSNYKKESLQEQEKKNEETSEAEKLEEQKKEKREKDEDESGTTQKNNSEKTAKKTSETNEENAKKKNIESDAREPEIETIPTTTQLRGKSKATGRIMGGWI